MLIENYGLALEGNCFLPLRPKFTFPEWQTLLSGPQLQAFYIF